VETGRLSKMAHIFNFLGVYSNEGINNKYIE